MSIDDLVAQRERTSDATWDAEMMCLTPRREHNVYASFDPTIGGRHVRAVMKGGLDVIRDDESQSAVVAGVDFGLRNPFVFLWARLVAPADAPVDESSDRWRIEIIDEYVERNRTMDEHIKAIAARPWPKPVWIGADPAGGQRSSQSGVSDIQCLRREGYKVIAPRSSVRTSIDIVRRRLDQGTLVIDPRCRFLIESLATYHYDEQDDASEQPVKDGPDHACDALRYLLVALEHGPGRVRRVRYV